MGIPLKPETIKFDGQKMVKTMGFRENPSIARGKTPEGHHPRPSPGRPAPGHRVAPGRVFANGAEGANGEGQQERLGMEVADCSSQMVEFTIIG